MKHNPGFLKLVDAARARVKECTVAQAKARLDRGEVLHFLDAREDYEFAKDHAKGARHLGKGIIERDVETCIPNKEEAILLYCGGGYRSVLAADALQQMGYTNVVSMDGGIKAFHRIARIPPGFDSPIHRYHIRIAHLLKRIRG